MSFTIALNFEDGVSRFIQCNPNEKVLDAAYRQRINLPMDCSDGVCGTCKCRCEQGEYQLGDDYLDEALSEQEAAQRLVLTCQMVPSSDCIIEVPIASTLCKTGSEEFAATVTSATTLSDSAIEFCLTLDDERGIAFLPGQYVNIAVPGSEASRAYSFSSLPGSRQISFLLRNVPGGMMSGYLTDRARPGDAIHLRGPQGSFYLRTPVRPMLFLAGGTGLAPFLSMLEQLAADASPQPVHLIYGVTHDHDLVKLEQLESYRRRLPNFSYLTCVASEASLSPHKGYVTQHLDESLLNDGDLDVYLCGPPPMVEAVLGDFQRRAFTPASFHYEKFAPSQVN
ncbi:benzoate 1,2-dioxygenase electron transfer component BenC [Serratia proteamaculans]|uniref:Ring-hydroxylating dioxygenase ferredoxin reductase family protein n=1 Tax=Serratia proteamaculans TaxID=28151 RepID=A0ABS0TZ80_SERPR|nr:benzoate 1,2-dioxygenase electron transfer component BenC [Serratia proteamaculans]MBI6183683.1 ring-hydroxylating dioxygenase ferredoxin reductase family protein [Serratia proteamaculans]CAI0742778.1 Benzoate 1,2-dioxygenase electron transfer component [Serratia proteamaculans]CAI0743332.1 Benzoate 1,2-dioxygenase electron transfer component [Serratia proteamaculans]